MKTHLTLYCTVAAAAIFIGSAGRAHSQTNAANTPADKEIVVTAQKSGDELLSKVPISISVLGGAKLDSAPTSSVNDLISRLPGVAAYNSAQGGGNKIAIRGVASGQSIYAGTSTVAYYLDDVPFAFVKTPLTPDANAYDLDHVEVLKGPQGTLYSSGALAGVVRILTRDANPDSLEAKAQGGLSFTKGGGTNYKGDAAINIPLIPGKLAVRGVVSYGDMSGWVDRPRINQQNYNGSRNEAYRLKVTARPDDNLTIKLSAWISRNHKDGVDGGYPDLTTYTSIDESSRINYETYDASISYDFDTFTIASTSSYIHLVNGGGFEITSPTATRPLRYTTAFQAKTFNQELRAYSRGSGPWKWSIGTAYRDSQDNRQLVSLLLRNSIIDQNKSRSIAVFGELAHLVAHDTIEFRGGLRYFHDDQPYLGFSSPGSGVLNPPYSSKQSFEKVTPRAVISWFPTPKHTIYASYSQGFRSGFNQGIDTIFAAPSLGPVRPDLLTNYEVGAKGTLGPLRYEAAVYYQDWKDPQLAQLVNIGTLDQPVVVPAPVNGTPLRGMGVDASLNVTVARGFNVGGSVSWNGLSYTGDIAVGGIKLYSKGQRAADSAAATASLYADYSFELGFGGLTGRLSADASHRSRITQTDGSTGKLYAGNNVDLVSSNFTISSPKGWAMKVFVENAGNWYGVVRPTSFVVRVSDSRLRPRTVGLSLSYKY